MLDVKWYESKPALTAIAAAALMFVHACLNAAFPHANDPISYTTFLICSTWAAVVCVRRARTGSQRKRRSWMLVSAGFLLYSVAIVFSAYIDLVVHGPSTIASWDDFFYFFSGVPFLLSISSPDDTRLFSLFFWLDVAQAVAVGWLTYLAVFGILPFSRATALPIPVEKMVWLFAIEAIALAVLGVARWVASPWRSREQWFYRVLAILPGRDGDLPAHLQLPGGEVQRCGRVGCADGFALLHFCGCRRVSAAAGHRPGGTAVAPAHYGDGGSRPAGAAGPGAGRAEPAGDPAAL